MKARNLFIQYGITMLPVVVQSIKEKRAGLQTLAEFLHQAWPQLKQRQQQAQFRRSTVSSRHDSRRDKLKLGRYFDLARRGQRSTRLALEALENYLYSEEEHFLDQALRLFETGYRFKESRLKLRMELQPHLCDRIARAS